LIITYAVLVNPKAGNTYNTEIAVLSDCESKMIQDPSDDILVGLLSVKLQ